MKFLTFIVYYTCDNVLEIVGVTHFSSYRLRNQLQSIHWPNLFSEYKYRFCCWKRKNLKHARTFSITKRSLIRQKVLCNQHTKQRLILTLRFSRFLTFFSTVWTARDNEESLGLGMTSLEVMLEAEVKFEEFVETRDADGIVAIEMMMMSQHCYLSTIGK